MHSVVYDPKLHLWITRTKNKRGMDVYIPWASKPTPAMLRKSVKKHWRIHRNRTVWDMPDNYYLNKGTPKTKIEVTK